MWWNKKHNNAKNKKLKVLLKKGGNTYYTFADKPKAYRFLIGMMNVEFATMGADANTAVEYLDEIIKALNKNDSAQAAYEAHSFKNRITTANPEQAYMQLATVYVLMNDEDVEDYNVELAKEKIAIWNKDPELRAFFLNIAYRLIKEQPTELNRTILAASVELTNQVIMANAGAKDLTAMQK